MTGEDTATNSSAKLAQEAQGGSASAATPKPSTGILAAPEQAAANEHASEYAKEHASEYARESGKESAKESATPAVGSRKSNITNALLSRLGVLELILLFTLALLLRCAFNFSLSHVNNFASCDAFEYINNGQALLQIFAQPLTFWQKSLSCLAGQSHSADWQQVRAALAPLKDLYISGPVFPAFLAIIVALSGGTVANVHHLWQALLAGNSLVSALSCVLIALIANEAFGRRSARISGVMAALYPGFIVNSGRLYSETFATFLLLALSYITLRGFRSGGNGFILSFLSGFLAAALQLTRSVMAVLTLALLPLTAIQQNGMRRLSFLLPFAFGFLLIALPWLGFQKLAFGGGGLVVDRVGHYNFFIGNNVDTQGWLSYPYPDGRNVEASTFPQLIQSAVKKSPARWVRLMLDKPLRLFAFPWNDFRTAIGPWEFRWQLAFHQFIVLLAFFGVGFTLLLSAKGSAPSKPQLYCRYYLAGLLAFHFIYCLFITVPRYNLTAMPELIVFAAASSAVMLRLSADHSKRRAGVMLAASFASLFVLLNNNLMPFFVSASVTAESAWVIQALIRLGAVMLSLAAVFFAVGTMQGKRRVAMTIACLVALVALPLLMIPLRANGRYLEWYQDINISSAPLHQQVKLPLNVCRKNSGGLFLLLDTASVRQHSDGLEFLVDGQRLPGPVLPSMSFAENFDRFLDLGPKNVQREGERMWDSLTNSAGCGNLDLRQWSMISMPEAVVKGAIARAVSNGSSSAEFDVSVKNLSERQMRIFGSYDVSERERIIPSLDVYSWEKVFYGIENPEGLSDTRYDIKAPAATLATSKQDLSDLPGIQNGKISMAVLVAPTAEIDSINSTNFSAMQLIASHKLGAISIDKVSGANLNTDLGALADCQDSLLVFCLHGRSRMCFGNACPAADIDTVYSGGKSGSYTYKSAWSPRRLASSNEWKDFEFVIPVKHTVEDASVRSIIANFRLVSPDSRYQNIPRPFSGKAEFAELVLDVYRLPANPIGLGHQVY